MDGSWASVNAPVTLIALRLPLLHGHVSYLRLNRLHSRGDRSHWHVSCAPSLVWTLVTVASALSGT
jgi:hypothetical protein